MFNVVGQCPTDVPIKSPCRYRGGPTYCDIGCEGSDNFDIKAVFTDLSRRLPADRKSFRYMYLYNTAIEELPANAFAGIQFNIIYTNYANQLKRINVAAFDGTAATLTEVYILNSLVSESVTNDSDLFGAIDTLKGLEYLYLKNTNVQSLPSLCLSERVSEHAFTVGHNSTEQSLEINFESQLKDPFDSRAFESIGCATTIRLGNNSMKYLDSNEFNVFLSQNPMNTVFDESIDCADSRNQWIQEKYPKVWRDLKCK
ncbi:unnamed protein product [Medioppia subpectinata]|uniref:Uncharacterized protein n=1 Tax=Medioppia subpectinata TaxID=1979941 RepID=A0A7R9L0D5_9ACAR|nr:unnamed protein product [Medioppia subpectinata]CAG2112090.1 unnamed protein product [Medioppia subpectinata]